MSHPTSKEQNLSRIRALCTAYESGFGHGIKRDRTCNPYATFSDESLAYGFGREAGEKRSAVETPCEHELSAASRVHYCLKGCGHVISAQDGRELPLKTKGDGS